MPEMDADFNRPRQVRMDDPLADLHFPAEADQQPLLGLGALGRQHLDGHQHLIAAIAGEVDGPHAALADRRQHVKRSQDQAERHALQQLGCLKARQLADSDQIVREALGVGAGVHRRGFPDRLEIRGGDQPAADDGLEKALERLLLHVRAPWWSGSEPNLANDNRSWNRIRL